MEPSERPSGKGQSEIEVLKAEINKKTSSEIAKEFLEIASDASRLKQKVEAGLQGPLRTSEFAGEINDEKSEKGKAENVRLQVIKILLTKENSSKIPIPEVEKTTGLAKLIIEKISKDIKPQDISEYEAPFLYELLKKTIQGEIADIDSLANEFKKLNLLNHVNKELYKKLQKSLIVVSVDQGLLKEEAEKKFIIKETQEDDNGRSRKNGVSYEDRKEYEKLNEEINRALEESIKPNSGKEPLSGDERFAIMKYYHGAEENLESPQIESAMKKLNLQKTDLENYNKLLKKIYRSTDPEHLMVFLTNDRLRNLLTGACNKFSLEQLEKDHIIEFKNPDVNDPKDKKKIVQFDKKKFKKLITKYHFQALEPIHDNTSQLYDQAMSMSASQYQYYFGGLQGVIENLCDNLMGQFKDDPETFKFLKDVRGRYQGTILTYAQTFHNLPLYAKDASSFEKWPQFLGQLFPSELAEVFDPDDRLMEMMRQEVALTLRRRVVLNKNIIPSDLFSGKYDEEGVRYSIKDMEAIEENLKKRMEALDKNNKIEDWEYKRARTYAIGIGLASLTDPEIISTADPSVDANFKGIYPLVSILSAKHNWGLGRGYPASGLFPHLMAMDVTLFPEQRGVLSRLFKKKSWVPAAFDEYAKGKEAEYGEKVFNELIDRNHSYQELLSMLNIAASTNSRMGWAVSPLMKEKLPKIAEVQQGIKFGDSSNWGKDEWNKYFELSMKIYGNSSLWWMVEDRTEIEMKRYLTQYLGKKGKLNGNKVDDYMYKEFNEGESALKRDFEIDLDGKGNIKKFTFPELRMIKMYQIIGETFHYYLNRNPADFIMLLTQLSPELLNDEVNYFILDERAFKENEGNAKKFEGKTDLEVKREIEKMKKLRALWGDEAFLLMGKVRSWVFDKNGLVEQLKDTEFNGKKIETWKDAMEYFSQQSGTAFERMLEDKKELKELRDKDDEKYFIRRGKIKREEKDFTDEKLQELIFGQNGLLNILSKEDPGGFNKEGQFTLGKLGIFYHMGEIWTLKQARTNPFSPDLDHFSSYKYLGKVGEDVIKRRLGDAQSVSKIIGEVAHLDEKLQHAAESKDLKEIFEIQKNVFMTLKGVIGLEYAHRANYIIASIVTQYFYEHSDTRIPFFTTPFNLPFKWLLGKEISLSKILGHSRHAMSWDENAARDYFRRLGHELHVIPVEGLWSIEQLDAAFDAKTDTFIYGNIAPSFIYFMMMYLAWTYAKKAMEEAEGKKK